MKLFWGRSIDFHIKVWHSHKFFVSCILPKLCTFLLLLLNRFKFQSKNVEWGKEVEACVWNVLMLFHVLWIIDAFLPQNFPTIFLCWLFLLKIQTQFSMSIHLNCLFNICLVNHSKNVRHYPPSLMSIPEAKWWLLRSCCRCNDIMLAVVCITWDERRRTRGEIAK